MVENKTKIGGAYFEQRLENSFCCKVSQRVTQGSYMKIEVDTVMTNGQVYKCIFEPHFCTLSKMLDSYHEFYHLIKSTSTEERIWGPGINPRVNKMLYLDQGLVKGAILCFRNPYFYFWQGESTSTANQPTNQLTN